MQKFDQIEPAPEDLEKPGLPHLGVYEILHLIRETDAANMHNIHRVQKVAEELGFDAFADWLDGPGGTRMNAEYSKILTEGVIARYDMEMGEFEAYFDSWANLPHYSR